MAIKSITAEVEWYPIYRYVDGYKDIDKTDLRVDTFKVYGVKRNGKWLEPSPGWIVGEFDKRRHREDWNYTQYIKTYRVVDEETA